MKLFEELPQEPVGFTVWEMVLMRSTSDHATAVVSVPRANESIVFTGVMDYLPNVDAVNWFCERSVSASSASRAKFTILYRRQ